MSDYKELMDLYNNLDLSDKRSEYSILLHKVNELITELLNRNNIKRNDDIKKHDFNLKEMTEDEMLSLFYEDLTIIKDKLLLLITVDGNKE